MTDQLVPLTEYIIALLPTATNMFNSGDHTTDLYTEPFVKLPSYQVFPSNEYVVLAVVSETDTNKLKLEDHATELERIELPLAKFANTVHLIVEPSA
jgi:hypothetical protein